MAETGLGTRLGMFEVVGELDIPPVRIDGDDAILGRDPDSDIVLEDPRVSRRHARVWIDEHRMMIQDLGSKAGTVLNGTTITAPVELRTGDHLRLGLTELAVVWNPGLADTLDMPVLRPGEIDTPEPGSVPTLTSPAAAAADPEQDGRYQTYVAPTSNRRRQVAARDSERTPELTTMLAGGMRRERVPPPERHRPDHGGTQRFGQVAEDVSDVAFDMTTDRMPMWMRTLLLSLRRGRR